MAGRAVTLRYVPHRPDLAEDKPKGADSAEYVAFELCGPGEVLVIDAMGWKYSSVGGDIKFFRLFQRKVGGLVTDGSVRDSVSLLEYGISRLFLLDDRQTRPCRLLAVAGQRRDPVRRGARETGRRPGRRRRRCGRGPPCDGE